MRERRAEDRVGCAEFETGGILDGMDRQAAGIQHQFVATRCGRSGG